jgi:hypothetical protein
LVGEARVEYAASGRSGCRVCRQKIDMDDLRIARMVQSQKLYARARGVCVSMCESG